jgi:hypothetical protein
MTVAVVLADPDIGAGIAADLTTVIDGPAFFVDGPTAPFKPRKLFNQAEPALGAPDTDETPSEIFDNVLTAPLQPSFGAHNFAPSCFHSASTGVIET